MTKKRFLVWIPFALILILFLALSAYEGGLSMVNYRVLRGLAGSDFVGLRYYERFFSMPDSGYVIVNSITQSLIAFLPGLTVGMLLSFLLGLIPSRMAKACIAAAALMVALVPNVLVQQAVVNLMNKAYAISEALSLREQSNILGNAELTRVVIGVVDAIPCVALCLFAGLSLQLSTNLSPWLGSLLGSMLPLMTLLLPSFSTVYLSINAMTMQDLQNFPYYSFRVGLQNGQYSLAAVSGTLSRLGSLVVGLLLAVAIGFIVKSNARKPRCREQGHSWALEMLLGFVGCVVVMGVALGVNGVGMLNMLNEVYIEAALNTIVTAFIAIIPAFLMCYTVIELSRHAMGKTSFIFAFMLVLLPLLAHFLLSTYMSMRTMGLLNTWFAPALAAVVNPMFLLVLVLLALQRPLTVRQSLFLAGGGALIAAAISVGDMVPGLLYTHGDVTGLATHLRGNLMSGGAMSAYESVEDYATRMETYDGFVTALKFVTMTLTMGLALPGVTLVMGGVGGARPGAPAPVQMEEAPVQEPAPAPQETREEIPLGDFLTQYMQQAAQQPQPAQPQPAPKQPAPADDLDFGNPGDVFS